MGPHRGPELVQFEDVVGRDRDHLRVGDVDPRVELGEFEVLLVVLGAEVSPREHEDHRVGPLQLD